MAPSVTASRARQRSFHEETRAHDHRLAAVPAGPLNPQRLHIGCCGTTRTARRWIRAREDGTGPFEQPIDPAQVTGSGSAHCGCGIQGVCRPGALRAPLGQLASRTDERTDQVPVQTHCHVWGRVDQTPRRLPGDSHHQRTRRTSLAGVESHHVHVRQDSHLPRVRAAARIRFRGQNPARLLSAGDGPCWHRRHRQPGFRRAPLRQPHPAEVRVAAVWRAGRFGVPAELLHPLTHRPATAGTVVAAFPRHVRDALDNAGDTGFIAASLTGISGRGTGAARQRQPLKRGARSADIVAVAIAGTHQELAGHLQDLATVSARPSQNELQVNSG